MSGEGEGQPHTSLLVRGAQQQASWTNDMRAIFGGVLKVKHQPFTAQCHCQLLKPKAVADALWDLQG